MKRILLIITAILIPVACGYGQEANKQTGTKSADIPTAIDPYALSLPRVTLPAGKDSWAIQIVTRGGFSGHGRGDLLINSTGHISVLEDGAEHSARLPLESRQDLERLLSTVKLDGSTVNRDSLCNDCYVIVFALYRKGRDGIQRQYTAVWDDSTFANLPSELKQLYSVAIQVRENAEKKWKKN